MNPHKILYIIIYTILLNGFIQQYIFKSEFVPLIPDVLLFILAFLKLPNNLKQIKHSVGNTIIVTFFILLVYGTIVAILNQISVISIVWGLRMIIRYLLLFTFVYTYFKASDVTKYKQIVFRCFWINTILVCFQYFIEHKFGDAIGGTFNNNGELFVFNIIYSFLISKDYFEGRAKRSSFILFLAIEMFIAMVAEIKMMYFAIPLAVYATYVFIKKFNIKHILIIITAFFLLIPAMKLAMSLIYKDDYINNVFDIESIQEETSHAYNLSEEAADFSFNRTTCINLATTVILKDNLHILTGYGIGSGNASPTFGSWISQRYSKITSYNWFTSSWLLIEYGWIGFVTWIFLLLCLIVRFYNIYKTTTDKQLQHWSSLGLLSALFTFIFAWYNNIPYYNAYFIYLFWAICFVAIRERKKIIKYDKIHNKTNINDKISN